MAQELMNKFYDLDNLVRIEVDIDPKAWDKLRNAEPKGGWGYKGGRYDWFQTNSVTITSRDFQAKKFPNVGIIKKSFAGSKDNIKPSFRLDFTRFQASNEAEIQALIGTKTLVLNNCKQDPLFIRQPLGYSLLRKAGVPSLRCNLGTVKINNASSTVYVNIEAFKKQFLEYNFKGNTKGNAYEIELQQDLVSETWRPGRWQGTPSFEGYSKFDDEKDIRLLAKIIASRDWNAVQKVVDVEAFIKFFAMETILKHWDGFTQTINNTFAYNDTVAVADPTADMIKFKFIPSGLDQILLEDRKVVFGGKPVLAQLVLNSSTKLALFQTIKIYTNGDVFSDAFTDKTIDRLANVLRQTSTPKENVDKAVKIMKDQIRQVREQAKKIDGMGYDRKHGVHLMELIPTVYSLWYFNVVSVMINELLKKRIE